MNEIDKYLLVFTKHTDGQLLNGMLADIARLTHRSRERVRQRAEKLGLLSFQKILKTPQTCVVCSKEFVEEPKSRARNKLSICSAKCRQVHHLHKYYIFVPCEICGTETLIFKSRFKQFGRRFCGKKCQGKWLATNYGTGTNRNRGDMRRKYPTNKKLLFLLMGKKQFTRDQFVVRFGYKGETSCYGALKTLVTSGIVTKISKGTYQIS